MVTMKIILSEFEKYYPRYDAKEKTLFLQGKMPVKDFIYLKQLIKNSKIEIQNLILKSR